MDNGRPRLRNYSVGGGRYLIIVCGCSIGAARLR